MSVTVRTGTTGDARTAARLHGVEIEEGFLASLGPGCLTVLYRRVVRHPGSFLLVAEDREGVAGMAAATEDLGGLYRTFAWRDGVKVAARCGARLVRALPKVAETLRYPSGDGAAAAELLSVVVSRRCRGQGVGRALVHEVQRELTRRGAAATRVVTGEGNEAALALYVRCGFRAARRMEVHRGTPSVVLVWP